MKRGMPTLVLQALGRAGLFCCLHPGTSCYIHQQLSLLGMFPTHNSLVSSLVSSPLLEPTTEVLQHSGGPQEETPILIPTYGHTHQH